MSRPLRQVGDTPLVEVEGVLAKLECANPCGSIKDRIGRYILDGTAVADEVHGTARDGSHAVALTVRQFDGATKTWGIELLGLPDSRFFRQVHRGTGSVTVSGRNVTVISEGAFGRIREHYLVADDDTWVYRLDESRDGGKSWNEGRTEYTMRRSK